MCAAAGTSQPIIGTLNRHIVAAVGAKDFRDVIEKTGVIAVSSTPQELGSLIAETAKEADVMIRDFGIEKLD